MSRKKLRSIAVERNENLRNDKIREFAEYQSHQVGFLDETSYDDRVPGRRNGWARKGSHTDMRRPFVCGRRLTAVAVMTLDGIIASQVLEGSLKWPLFLDFLEHDVMPQMTPFADGGPFSVLVLDNARIHHGEQIMALAQQFGVRITFLPLYSPDLNLIEEAFSKIKAFLCRNDDIFHRGHGFGVACNLLQALQVITPDDAAGYFIHAGYF